MSDRGPITTHVLDTSIGRPAAEVVITLSRKSSGDTWDNISTISTNSDGRAVGFIRAGGLEQGIYRLTFEVGAYFLARGGVSFYPSVSVDFETDAKQEHYHVPLLISPFGYSTYRGS